MPSDERKKRRKKKKGSRRNADATAVVDDDEERGGATILPVDVGEAEFANSATFNADNEPLVMAAVEGDDDYNDNNYDDAILVVDANGDEAAADVDYADASHALVHGDDEEDAIPAPILEPHLDGTIGENGGGESAFQDGLAVATAVDTAAEDEYIYSAIEYDPDSKPPLHKNRRFRVYTCLAMSIVVAVAVVVAVYVTKSAKGADVTDIETLWDGDPTQSPSAPPTTDREASGIREQIEAGVLSRGVNFTDMDREDPRYLALDWILHADQLQLDSDDENLYQRYVLALMAFALDSLAWYSCGNHQKFGNVTEDFVVEECESKNMGTGQIEKHGVWLSSTEECDWFGVICSQDEVVRGVELIGNDLIGEIPPEISQLRFLQYLALNGNCLYGTIPPELGNMPSLLSLELHGNGLSGELPSELADASKLQLLNVAMQYQYQYACIRSDGRTVNTLFQMGGATEGGPQYNYGLQGAPLQQGVEKWRSMKGLHLFDNSFVGTVAEEIGQLKYLVFLRSQKNMFSGLIPYGIGQLKKCREVYFSMNDLQLDIPREIGGMEDLEDLRVNENRMTGVIPSEIYNLKKLKKLWLQDTSGCDMVNVTDPNDPTVVFEQQECKITRDVGFSGTLGTEIGNLKKLNQLLINNNPIAGTIPTEIGLCENLSMLHIHKTNIVGSSPRELCELRDKNLNIKGGMTGIFYSDWRGRAPLRSHAAHPQDQHRGLVPAGTVRAPR
eukprot:CAMPEP_0181134596 /NCGR_PEP_ID=MMETSP1071-20121207/32172_1 /TAXON_ID=35127 /ORGANISM="Thalassiosira sp., Strain NH16" /LENGTH=728 /DNA_ID=CAMNT_0023221125 /DNA_START=39 /DNA_END=2225 /DNA_ORIENTATION=-